MNLQWLPTCGSSQPGKYISSCLAGAGTGAAGPKSRASCCGNTVAGALAKGLEEMCKRPMLVANPALSQDELDGPEMTAKEQLAG